MIDLGLKREREIERQREMLWRFRINNQQSKDDTKSSPSVSLSSQKNVQLIEIPRI